VTLDADNMLRSHSMDLEQCSSRATGTLREVTTRCGVGRRAGRHRGGPLTVNTSRMVYLEANAAILPRPRSATGGWAAR